MQILQMHSFPIEQISDVEAKEWQLAEWHYSRAFPTRLLAYSRAFNLAPVTTRLRRDREALRSLAECATPVQTAVDALLGGDEMANPHQAFAALTLHQQAHLLSLFRDVGALQDTLTGADADDPPTHVAARWAVIADNLDTVLWRKRWVDWNVRWIDRLQQQRLRATTYLMVTWEPPDVSGKALATSLEHATARPVQILADLPSVLQGEYDEEATLLRPRDSLHPWLAVLLAYDMRGTIDARSLHPLIDVPFDVALALDLGTVPQHRALRRAELAHNAARLQLADTKITDMRAQRLQGDAERAMHALTHQNLHDVQLAILVSGPTREHLEQHVAEIMDRAGSQLALFRPAYCQGEAIKLWSTTPANRIDMPWKRRNLLSHGVGCLMGILGHHRAGNTGGLLWGLDAVRRAPVYADLFADNQAAHMVILGKTGFGKVRRMAA